MKTLILKIKRQFWRFRLSNLEDKILWRYCLKPEKYQYLMKRTNFCKRIALDYSLRKFSEQLEMLQKVYKLTIERL